MCTKLASVEFFCMLLTAKQNMSINLSSTISVDLKKFPFSVTLGVAVVSFILCIIVELEPLLDYYTINRNHAPLQCYKKTFFCEFLCHP